MTGSNNAASQILKFFKADKIWYQFLFAKNKDVYEWNNKEDVWLDMIRRKLIFFHKKKQI